MIYAPIAERLYFITYAARLGVYYKVVRPLGFLAEAPTAVKILARWAAGEGLTHRLPDLSLIPLP